jgi:hypothetical protein
MSVQCAWEGGWSLDAVNRKENLEIIPASVNRSKGKGECDNGTVLEIIDKIKKWL